MRKISLNESQFNRIVSKCVKKALNEGSLYDYGDIIGAENVITQYTLDILKSLGKKAIPIMYCINPNSTAIGNSRITDSDFDSIRNAIDQDGLANDGTRGYDLLELAKMIENGEF